MSKGEVIIKQGALCKELSIIRSGSVIEKKTGTTYGAWKAFGEQGLWGLSLGLVLGLGLTWAFTFWQP